jgi:hypothetical protein
MNRESVYVVVIAIMLAGTSETAHGFVVREGRSISVERRDSLDCGVTDLENGDVTKSMLNGIIPMYSFSCDDGYHLKGAATLICIANKLHGSMPECVETKSYFVSNTCPVSLSSSETCDVQCGGGDYCKIKPGNAIRCCRMKRIISSSFAGKQNRCSESCNYPPNQPQSNPNPPNQPQTTPEPENSEPTVVATTQADPTTTQIAEATTAKEATTPEQTETPEVATTEEPEATPTEPTDCDVKAPTNGDVQKQVVNSVAVKYTFTCQTGFHVKGSASLTCVDGQLDGNPPVCQATANSFTTNGCTVSLSPQEICTATCAGDEYCKKTSAGLRCCRQQRIKFDSFAGSVDRCSESCVLPIQPKPPCVDNHRSCRPFFGYGRYCKSVSLQRYTKYCKKTCKLC